MMTPGIRVSPLALVTCAVLVVLEVACGRSSALAGPTHSPEVDASDAAGATRNAAASTASATSAATAVAAPASVPPAKPRQEEGGFAAEAAPTEATLRRAADAVRALWKGESTAGASHLAGDRWVKVEFLCVGGARKDGHPAGQAAAAALAAERRGRSEIIGEIASCDEATRCCALHVHERKDKQRRYVDEVCFDDQLQVTGVVYTDEGGCRG